MARKKKGAEAGAEDEEQKRPNKVTIIISAVLVIVIWLAIFAMLIKFDVGGFGSGVMRPIFKDVPVIKAILPTTEDADEVNSYQYKSLAEAINKIKDLEVEVQDSKKDADTYKEQVADLQAEVNRLKTFEADQESFNALKQKFYDEVVFGKDAIPYDNYKTYYEAINPEYAEKLYLQVLQKYVYDERYKELANVYSAMKPKQAAATLYEMTGDLDKVVSILENMDTTARANILNALSAQDAVFAGKITVLLAPDKDN